MDLKRAAAIFPTIAEKLPIETRNSTRKHLIQLLKLNNEQVPENLEEQEPSPNNVQKEEIEQPRQMLSLEERVQQQREQLLELPSVILLKRRAKQETPKRILLLGKTKDDDDQEFNDELAQQELTMELQEQAARLRENTLMFAEQLKADKLVIDAYY